MPAAWVAVDVTGLLVGVLALALAVGFKYIMRAIGHVLSWSLPLIGRVDLGAPFVAAGNAVEGWAISMLKWSWHGIAVLFSAIGWGFETAFESVVNVASHLGDQIAHIMVTELPSVLTRAEAFALHHALSVSNSLTYKIGQAVGHLEHDIGISQGRAISAAHNYTDAQTQHAIDTARALVNSATTDLNREISDIRTKLGTAVANLDRTIGDNLKASEAYARAKANGAIDVAAGEFAQAKAYALQQARIAISTDAKALSTEAKVLAGQITTVGNVAEQGISEAKAQAQSLFNTAESAASTALTSVQNVLQGEITATGTTAEQGISSAKALAQSLFGQAESTASAAVKSAVGTLTGEIQGVAGSVPGTIEGVLGGVYTDVTGRSAAQAGDLSGIESLLAGAITGAISTVAARVANLEECAVTKCSGPNNLNGLLKDIMGLSGLVGVGAFVSEVVYHPAQAAAQFKRVESGIYSGAESLLNDILSL